jgi:hypothetical protein
MLVGLLALGLAVAAPQAAAAAPQTKVAVMPLASVEGVPGKTAEALTEAVSAEVRKRSKAQVITQREISAILSLEQQKSMLGCQNDACFAEIGGALGVDQLVSGDLSVLGESWLFHLKLLDAKKAVVLHNSDRRLRGGTIDDVLDALPAMVGELFPPEARAAEVAAVQPPPAQSGKGTSGSKGAGGPVITPAKIEVGPRGGGAVVAEPEPRDGAEPGQPEGSGGEEAEGPLPPPTAPMPGRTPARAVLPAFLERSIPVPLRARGEMRVFTDGDKHFLALAPFGDPGAPVFFGKGRKLFQQEVLARRERDTTAYEVALWDPRVPEGRVEVSLRGEEALVRCGGREVTLTAVPKRKGGLLLVAATYYAPPFIRKPLALARDDDGNFFFVDAARDAGPRGADYRLYAGPKGALTRVELEDVERQGDAVVLRTAKGRLRIARQGGGPKVDWLAEGGRRMLVWMDPAENEALVFGELGVYGGAPLGSPCDLAFLGR